MTSKVACETCGSTDTVGVNANSGKNQCDRCFRGLSRLQTVADVEREAFRRRLGMFVQSARELSIQWEHYGHGDTAGYPAYLPSFDEFVYDLITWEAAEAESSD